VWGRARRGRCAGSTIGRSGAFYRIEPNRGIRRSLDLYKFRRTATIRLMTHGLTRHRDCDTRFVSADPRAAAWHARGYYDCHIRA